MRWRTESGSSALFWITLAVLLGYANALGGPFQFDDHNVIVNEPQVHGWANWFAALANGIRPLLKFSYTLNWTLGWGTTGFHLTNLLVHLANAWLVYLLAQAFVLQQWQKYRLRHVALLTALLFALHPVHTEAVTYISGRSASLMTLFYLAGLLGYIRGRTEEDWKLLYLFTPVLFLLALATKETAVTFPLALLAWELCCGGRWQAALRPMWASWAVLCIATLFFLFNDSYATQIQRSAGFNDMQGNLATHLAGFIWLLRQWALPLWLNIDPDLPKLDGIGDALWPLAIMIGLVAITITSWRRRPWISFALVWAMLQLIALYLYLPRIDIANERQLYLAGWPLLLALGAELALRFDTRMLLAAAAALLLACAGLTVQRNRDYASEIALWEDTVQKSPHKARVHNNLGHAYLLAQRHEEARKEFLTALELDPTLYQAQHNLYRTDDEMEKAGGTLRP
ncbi:MAG: tetratricopeptide repeat protein [Pseudomonadota bacterium]